MQATVRDFRPEDGSGTVFLDDGAGALGQVDGPLTRAVRDGAICYLDEVVEARQDTTVVLHPLADGTADIPPPTGDRAPGPGAEKRPPISSEGLAPDTRVRL